MQYQDAYADGAVRYDVGQRANFVTLPMAIEALRLVRAWTPDRIQAHAAQLWAPIVPQLQAAGYTAEDEAWRGQHVVGVRPPPGTDMATIAARLAERRVMVSLRGAAVRVSPHLYNTAADMQALLGALL